MSHEHDQATEEAVFEAYFAAAFPQYAGTPAPPQPPLGGTPQAPAPTPPPVGGPTEDEQFDA